jgi:hypothetical protein
MLSHFYRQITCRKHPDMIADLLACGLTSDVKSFDVILAPTHKKTRLI